MKIKLTYTEEMRNQDLLWETESEDTKVMEKLFEKIISEAKEKGLKEYCYIWQGDKECLCNVYESEEDWDNGKEPIVEGVGYCKPLIKYLEDMLNQHNNAKDDSEEDELELAKVIENIEKLGWNATLEDDNYVSLQIYSPAGQDFNISVDTENDVDAFIENIYKCYENFDVSYETYLWLDNEGHGINGAPYDMRDLYNDMEACEQLILKLYNELKQKKYHHKVFKKLLL